MQHRIFESDFFVGNRQKLRRAVKEQVIVVPASGLMQTSADENFPLHQDRHFWYLTGLDIANAALVMDGDETYVIMPKDSRYLKLFHGTHKLDDYAKTSGIDAYVDGREGFRRLSQSLSTARKVATPQAPPAFMADYGVYTNPARARLARRLKRLVPGLKFIDLRPALIPLRQIKQPQEIEALQQAIGITFAGLEVVEKEWPSLKYEHEIEAILNYEYRRRGATGHGFDPIVADGPAGAIIHYRENNQPLKSASLLIDTGAGVDHYSADISRTLINHDKASDRLLKVYAAVEAVHGYARDIMKPGVKHRDYERMVEEKMGEELIGLGLIKENTREAVRKYYPHLTSHHLGLDVHDIATYDETFAPGMVLTVEPGIYIIEEGIGVRIEDDVLITDKSNMLMQGKRPTGA